MESLNFKPDVGELASRSANTLHSIPDLDRSESTHQSAFSNPSSSSLDEWNENERSKAENPVHRRNEHSNEARHDDYDEDDVLISPYVRYKDYKEQDASPTAKEPGGSGAEDEDDDDVLIAPQARVTPDPHLLNHIQWPPKVNIYAEGD